MKRNGANTASGATTALDAVLESDRELARRYRNVVRQAVRVRVSEYHVTNACNIRCRGCWFFAFEHDKATRENKDLGRLDEFLANEVSARRINTALVIGGEPTLFEDRLALFVRHMRHVTISTNGVKKLPVVGFENVAVGITLFGGGPLDDALRGWRPGERRFSGLFETALKQYAGDPRAGFVYAVTEDGVDHVDKTVRQIAANGNRVTFNYYTPYGGDGDCDEGRRRELPEELLAVKRRYPDTVTSHPYFIRALITGRSHGVPFGYDVCPSISRDHPDNRKRIDGGNPTLPFFKAWAADLETLKVCCTSGHCRGCRDSQAVQSWLLVSRERFLADANALGTWVEVAESYWAQFVWSRYHPSRREAACRPPETATVVEEQAEKSQERSA